jgi:hypothetical protein
MIAAVIVMVRAPAAPLVRRRAVLGLVSLQALALIVMMIMLLLDLPRIGYAHAALVLIASLWFAMIGFWLIEESAQFASRRCTDNDTRSSFADGAGEHD